MNNELSIIDEPRQLSDADIAEHRARIDALLSESSAPMVCIQSVSHDIKKRSGELHGGRTWRHKEANQLELQHLKRIDAELLKHWRADDSQITATRYRTIAEESKTLWAAAAETLSIQWQIQDTKAAIRAVEDRTDRLSLSRTRG